MRFGTRWKGSHTDNGVRLISQDVSIDAAAPSKVRDLVLTLAGGTAVAGDARLLASEITTNAILHGTWLPGDRLAVTIVRDDETLSVSVVGPGQPQPHGVDSIEEGDAPGGFGLGLVADLSEDWAMEALDDEKTRVWFQLAL